MPRHAVSKPIKGYLQVVKIMVYSLTTIVVIAALLDRSPHRSVTGAATVGEKLIESRRTVPDDSLKRRQAPLQLSVNH